MKGYISASQGVVLLYKYFGKPQSLDKGPESYLGWIQDLFKPMGFFVLVSMGFGSGLVQAATTKQLVNESWMKNFLPCFGEAEKEEGECCL